MRGLSITGEIKVFKVTTIVEDYNDDDDDIDEETGEVKVEHDYLNELQISEAKEINSDYQVGDEILRNVEQYFENYDYKKIYG